MTSIVTIAAAAILVLASFNDAAPATSHTKRANQLPGLSNIKHVVYFMQVSEIGRTKEKPCLSMPTYLNLGKSLF